MNQTKINNPKMASRWLYHGQDGAPCGLITSKTAPNGPTWLLRRLQDGPRCRHHGPRRLQRGPWRQKSLKNLWFFYDFLDSFKFCGISLTFNKLVTASRTNRESVTIHDREALEPSQIPEVMRLRFSELSSTQMRPVAGHLLGYLLRS